MIDAATLRSRFDEPGPMTVGLEEEVMVLDGETLELVPRAAEVLAEAAAGDAPRAHLQPELVAAQLEIATTPVAGVPAGVEQLAEARRSLAVAGSALGLRLACAGAHPSSATEGDIAAGERYEAFGTEFGIIARRQLVSALQVHVAVRPADRALAVHNAVRAYLPEVAALAANAPYHGGVDTGLASVRPTLAEQLPRQGVPPLLAGWEVYAEALRWVGDSGSWWWEARPHHAHGTLEIRVPDAQGTVGDAAAVASMAYALVVWLVARHADGEVLPAVETWRIEENRWSALRHGLDGSMRDLVTGAPEPTAQRIDRLLAELDATGVDLSGSRELLAAGGPATRLRQAAGGDAHAATEHLAASFLEGTGG